MTKSLHLFALCALLWATLLAPAPAQETAVQHAFTAEYVVPEGAENLEVYKAMKEEKFLEAAAEFLNALFVIPVDVHLVMAETGTVNAFYSPEHHAVILSYELILHFVELFSDVEDSDQAAQMASGAFLFVIFHELGHALISELELPTVGREEDAVDEFATLLLINFGEEGEISILGAATWFASTSDGEDSTPFWDEHSLDMQRFYGIFALLYGTNPERYADMAKELTIPEERLARAQRDYERKDAAWNKLLEPHIKGD